MNECLEAGDRQADLATAELSAGCMSASGQVLACSLDRRTTNSDGY